MENNINKKETSTIHVAFTIDNNYSTHCAVTMASILKNTNSFICFHIVSNGLSDKNKKKLSSLHFNYNINFYEVSKDCLLNMPLNREHISLAAYYLLMLSSFIKEEKVVFLDADTIVLEDIYNLWKIDISDVAIAAVVDESNDYHEKRLNLHSYFNSGVLLINMKKYKQKSLSDYLKILEEYKENIVCQDQDILNIAFKDSVKLIDLKWNTNAVLYYNDIFSDSTITLKESYIAKDSPAILHYTGPSKPWQFTNNHPRKLEYLRYLLFTKCYKNIAIQILLFILSLIIKIDITYKEKTLKLFTLKIFSIYGKNTKKVILFNRISLPLIRR